MSDSKSAGTSLTDPSGEPRPSAERPSAHPASRDTAPQGTAPNHAAHNTAPSDTAPKQPVADASRIQTLDVLRGFALLGILLLNILGFGLLAASYSNPAVDLASGSLLDRATWATVELFAEGAMRCLFSVLFGAGVVLFATGARAKSGFLHYKRTFWLLMFGLFDAFILLWNGDILTSYAIAGAILYWLRNWRARWLLVVAAVLILAMSGFYQVVQLGIGATEQAAIEVAKAADPETVDPTTRQLAVQWEDFSAGFSPSDTARADELEQRRQSYATAFRWNAKKTTEMLFFVVPVFMIWDSLAMMIIGMALFKLGVLHGSRSNAFYWRLTVAGFAVGLLTNGYEVTRALASDLSLYTVFAQMQPTYHLGRLAMCVGYIGLVVLFAKSSLWSRLRGMLSSVGRMALTNYLMHSVIAMVIFTGAGFGLVGALSRWQLYPIVVAIWVLQLFLSEWWMARYRFGPLEWLWRLLTYGRRSAFLR